MNALAKRFISSAEVGTLRKKPRRTTAYNVVTASQHASVRTAFGEEVPESKGLITCARND